MYGRGDSNVQKLLAGSAVEEKESPARGKDKGDQAAGVSWPSKGLFLRFSRRRRIITKSVRINTCCHSPEDTWPIYPNHYNSIFRRNRPKELLLLLLSSH